MKKTLIVILILFSIKSNAQCWMNQKPIKTDNIKFITPLVIVDKSMRFYEPTGFSGTGVHVGAWFPIFGVTVGGVESKFNDYTPTTREMAITILSRYKTMEDKIQVIPFFSFGTHNFHDVGVRIGYRVGDGVYFGAVASRSMKYGISISVSINDSK